MCAYHFSIFVGGFKLLIFFLWFSCNHLPFFYWFHCTFFFWSIIWDQVWNWIYDIGGSQTGMCIRVLFHSWVMMSQLVGKIRPKETYLNLVQHTQCYKFINKHIRKWKVAIYLKAPVPPVFTIPNFFASSRWVKNKINRETVLIPIQESMPHLIMFFQNFPALPLNYHICKAYTSRFMRKADFTERYYAYTWLKKYHRSHTVLS